MISFVQHLFLNRAQNVWMTMTKTSRTKPNNESKRTAQLRWPSVSVSLHTQWIWMSAPFKWLMVDTWNTFINRLLLRFIFCSSGREQRPQTGKTTTMASAATDCAKLRNIEMQNKSQMKQRQQQKAANASSASPNYNVLHSQCENDI